MIRAAQSRTNPFIFRWVFLSVWEKRKNGNGLRKKKRTHEECQTSHQLKLYPAESASKLWRVKSLMVELTILIQKGEKSCIDYLHEIRKSSLALIVYKSHSITSQVCIFPR